MIGIQKKVLHFLLMAILFVALGCEAPGKKSEEKSEKTGLAFVDWSAGLPSSGQWRQGLAFHDMNNDGHLDILATPRRIAPDDEARPAVYGTATARVIEK